MHTGVPFLLVKVKVKTIFLYISLEGLGLK